MRSAKTWVSRASSALVGAFTQRNRNEPSGAWIEERDMLDIMHAISNTGHADIAGVYTKLLCGSRSHLRAFVSLLGADAYEPQLLYAADKAGSDVPAVETIEYWLGDDSDAICI